MIQVDLYLGSDLGRWVLDHIEPEAVRHVITDDAEAAELAEARGLPILRRRQLDASAKRCEKGEK